MIAGRNSPAVLATFVVLAVAFTVSCKDQRVHAVDDILEFAADAPFTIGPPKTSWSGFAVLVADTALPAYNRIFQYFDSDAESRAELYENLPAALLRVLPVSRILRVSSSPAGRDTLLVTAVFERPDHDRFASLLDRVLSAGDSADPSAAELAAFRDGLKRARAELQTIDTAYFRVTKPPLVASLRTASGVRDSIVADSLSFVATRHIKALVKGATLRLTDFDDYSRVVGGSVAGSVKGLVRPGDVGWYSESRIVASMHVECEASRDTARTSETAYVITQDKPSRATVEFLCLWLGEDAEQWQVVRPTAIRARLVGTVGTDTMLGDWKQLRP